MGILVAILIVVIWLIHLAYSLVFVSVSYTSGWMYVHLIVQAYLYTGLFITGHDAMHGLIAKRRSVNTVFGWISSMLFAGLSYSRLRKNHFLHHQFPGTEKDPDFFVKSQNFFAWWFMFLKRYATIGQFLFMAIMFNILKIWIEPLSLVIFWMLPAFIATFQLFFVGTFLPHRKPHEDYMIPHKARSQKGPHWWAMLSCYFFGYHWEHHEEPQTPWWKLYKLKNEGIYRND